MRRGRLASVLGEYRGAFVDSWGTVALEEEQWTVRVRAGAVADSAGHTGVTYHHSRVVDIAESALETFLTSFATCSWGEAPTTTTAGAAASRRGRNGCSEWTSARTSAARANAETTCIDRMIAPESRPRSRSDEGASARYVTEE